MHEWHTEMPFRQANCPISVLPPFYLCRKRFHYLIWSAEDKRLLLSSFRIYPLPPWWEETSAQKGDLTEGGKIAPTMLSSLRNCQVSRTICSHWVWPKETCACPQKIETFGICLQIARHTLTLSAHGLTVWICTKYTKCYLGPEKTRKQKNSKRCHCGQI